MAGAPRLMAGCRRVASRRAFLRAAAAAGAAVAGAGAVSCEDTGFDAVPLSHARAGRGTGVVRFANWPDYLDRAGPPPYRYPTLAEFTRTTGVAVQYSEPIDSNERFFGQIGIPLALGKSTGYDLVVLSDWMAAELIRLGWAERLSPDLVPNSARLLPQFRDWPVMQVRRYSLPWQGGFTGIGYNLAVTGRPIVSVSELLTAPDLRGKVSLVDDMRDVMGLVMLDSGADPASFTHRDFSAALGRLSRAVTAGQIGVVTNDYTGALVRGTIAAGVVWSGDIVELQAAHPRIGFTWPPGGGMLWTDNMLIPARASNMTGAQRLMNYYYQPRPAAELAAYLKYLCPVEGAEAFASPGLASEQYVFPGPALLATGHFFKVLTLTQSASYTSEYQTALGLLQLTIQHGLRRKRGPA